MPLVGTLAENRLIVGEEYREGNAAPAAGNLEFIQYCEQQLPAGKRIVAVRVDSAAYQSALFNACEKKEELSLPIEARVTLTNLYLSRGRLVIAWCPKFVLGCQKAITYDTNITFIAR